MINPAASAMMTSILSQTARVRGEKIHELCMLFTTPLADFNRTPHPVVKTGRGSISEFTCIGGDPAGLCSRTAVG